MAIDFGKNHSFINQIQPGMKNINTMFTVLEIGKFINN